jgi:hypothetical protein
VLAIFLINGDLLSNQWILVIEIGLGFFLVQLALSVSFCSRMRRHERAIKRFSRDYDQGGDGRNGQRKLPTNFAWIHWVVANFPPDETAAYSNFTRDDVLQELDTRIASNGNYLLLQRMGVMAPLLGVVLTVAGFYWLKVGKEDESLQSILMAVTPLVSGVGTGAVLAIINQVLLHIAGQRVESLRISARTWFDKVIWSQSAGDRQATATKALQAIDQFAANSKLITASTASMRDAASQFREVIQSFTAKTEGIPAALCDVQRTTAAAADTLEELIRVGSRAVANLDVSVAAFRSTLDHEFAAGAKLQRRSSRALAKSVEQIASYANTTAQLSEFVTQGIAPATSQLAEFGATLAGLKNAIETMKRGIDTHDDINRLNDTLARAADISDAISALPEQFRSVLEQNVHVGHDAASTGTSGRSVLPLPARPR